MKNENPMDFNPNNEKKAKMLVVIVITFIVAMVPNGIYAFAIAIDPSTKPQFFFFKNSLTISGIVHILTILNYSSSFFVYVYFSESFRRDLKYLMCDKLRTRGNKILTVNAELGSGNEADNGDGHTNTGNIVQVAVHRDPFFDE